MPEEIAVPFQVDYSHSSELWEYKIKFEDSFFDISQQHIHPVHLRRVCLLQQPASFSVSLDRFSSCLMLQIHSRNSAAGQANGSCQDHSGIFIRLLEDMAVSSFSWISAACYHFSFSSPLSDALSLLSIEASIGHCGHGCRRQRAGQSSVSEKRAAEVLGSLEEIRLLMEDELYVRMSCN